VRTPLIIGHRGTAATAPENTLVSFEQALDAGADGLEFDVHLARDGVPVVIHDDTLRRTAMRPGRVADFTSTELTAIDVGTWFNRKFPKRAQPEYAEARIPTLKQVFELAGGRASQLYVELKGADASKLASPVASLVNEFELKASVVVESFDHAAVAESKRVDPTIRTAALFEPKLRHPRPSARWLRTRAEECGADEIALHHSMATQKVVGQLAADGLPVVIWTADSPAWVRRAVRYGIAAIITNNPAVLLEARDSQES
jgi:glycerophosphoryl diester phosphodiesterase